jgi:hypothetical protein
MRIPFSSLSRKFQGGAKMKDRNSGLPTDQRENSLKVRAHFASKLMTAARVATKSLDEKTKGEKGHDADDGPQEESPNASQMAGFVAVAVPAQCAFGVGHNSTCHESPNEDDESEKQSS